MIPQVVASERGRGQTEGVSGGWGVEDRENSRPKDMGRPGKGGLGGGETPKYKEGRGLPGGE